MDIHAANDVLGHDFAAPRFLILANNLRQSIRQSPILGPYRGCGASLLSLFGFLLDHACSTLTAFDVWYRRLWWLGGHRCACPSDMFCRQSVMHSCVCKFCDVSKLAVPYRIIHTLFNLFRKARHIPPKPAQA